MHGIIDSWQGIGYVVDRRSGDEHDTWLVAVEEAFATFDMNAMCCTITPWNWTLFSARIGQHGNLYDISEAWRYDGVTLKRALVFPAFESSISVFFFTNHIHITRRRVSAALSI